MSVAILHLGFASSITIRRFVFSTDAKIVSSSSGDKERASITSTPSPFSIIAPQPQAQYELASQLRQSLYESLPV